jgi:hypothetical protein
LHNAEVQYVSQQSGDLKLIRDWLDSFYQFVIDKRITSHYYSDQMWDWEKAPRRDSAIAASQLLDDGREIALELEDRVIPAAKRLGVDPFVLETVRKRLDWLRNTLALPITSRVSGRSEARGQSNPAEGHALIKEVIDLCRDSYRELEAALSDEPPNKERSGHPGRPTASHLIVGEFRRMATAGEVTSNDKRSGVAIRLRRWQQQNHPDTRILATDTIRKKIGLLWDSQFKT